MRIAAIAIGALLVGSPAFSGEPITAKISVCFTPAEQCEGKIVDAIDGAQSSNRVQAFGFTGMSNHPRASASRGKGC